METRRLLLKEIDISDKVELFNILKDGDTTKYLSYDKLNNQREALEMIIKYMNPSYLESEYSIFLKKEKKMIGVIGFHTYNSNENSLMLEFILNKDYQNKGYMTEALKEIMDYGFNNLNLNKIKVALMEDNERCLNLIGKLGFKYESQMIEDFFDKGYHNVLYYSKYKED